MRIAPFGVEQWMNEWEDGAVLNLAETCVDSMTVDELLELSGKREETMRGLIGLRLSYGDIRGSEKLLGAIASLHTRAGSGNVIVMNGGSAANFLSLYTLVESGDEVVCAVPTYQQLYSIPESFGASVKLLRLREEDGWLPDVRELASLVTPRTKLICLNNPNNPTGALMDAPLLKEITEIARAADAWIHCDEVYRFLAHDDGRTPPSITDLYEKGVASGSLSKCFSLAGLRVGWLVGPEAFIEEVFSRRDYTTISCGRVDDLLGRLALESREKIFARNIPIARVCAKQLEAWAAEEPRVSLVTPKAGTTAFPRYDYNLGSEDFCRRLYERDGTFLLPGKCFGDEYDRHLRFGYAYSPDKLTEGLGKVSAFLRTLEEEGL